MKFITIGMILFFFTPQLFAQITIKSVSSKNPKAIVKYPSDIKLFRGQVLHANFGQGEECDLKILGVKKNVALVNTGDCRAFGRLQIGQEVFRDAKPMEGEVGKTNPAEVYKPKSGLYYNGLAHLILPSDFTFSGKTASSSFEGSGDIEMGLGLGGEAVFDINERMGVSAAFLYEIPRSLENTEAKFSAAYLTGNYYFFPSNKIYLFGGLNYPLLIKIDDASTDYSISPDIGLQFGIGGRFDKFSVDISHRILKGSGTIKSTSLGNTDLDSAEVSGIVFTGKYHFK